MKQYLDLLKTIQLQGVYKPAARENMPGTTSLFGYQFRHNLAEGFPLLTTKEVNFKNIVVELMWFLKGDSNIKYLIDNGCNIWNEDAYQYYLKVCERVERFPTSLEEFIKDIKTGAEQFIEGYKLGDTGYQYPTVWRNWKTSDEDHRGTIDQIQNVINSLITNPEGRRHIVTAIDPVNDTNLALYWCHCMFQFNARPIHIGTRIKIYKNTHFDEEVIPTHEFLDSKNIPKYYLDCQLYQRSADVFLGVPYNIASYALLTEIISRLVGMVPGEFIHTFGDVHIYDNHKEAVKEQLTRIPSSLPKLMFHDGITENGLIDLDTFLEAFEFEDIALLGYNPQERIKAKLSTGLIK